MVFCVQFPLNGLDPVRHVKDAFAILKLKGFWASKTVTAETPRQCRGGYVLTNLD